MPKVRRIKTKYPGVYYVMGRSLSRPGKSERVYYIRYRKDGRESEEAAGRQFRDAMTAAKAAGIRVECVEGKRLSRKEIQNRAGSKMSQNQSVMPVSETYMIEAEPFSTTHEKAAPFISKEIYKEIFRNSNDGIVLTDSKGTVLEMNEAQEVLLGWSREESIGKNIYEIGIFSQEKKKKDYQGIRLLIGGKVARFIHEFELNRKDGTRVFVEISTRVLEKNGKPVGLINSIRDITERKRMDHALQESEEMARALLNATTDSVILVDSKGIVLDLNMTFASQLGRSENELIGKKLWDLIPYEINDSKKNVDQVVHTGKSVRFDKKYRGMATDNVIYPVPDMNKKVSRVAIFTRDISTFKKAETELLQHKDHLEELVKKRTANLEQANVALKVLLKRREEDKTELEEKMMLNIKELVLPYVEEWKNSGLSIDHKALSDIIEYNLNEIISPFARTLASQYYNLSPTEIRIANLIKQGKSTKQIARRLKVSSRTIDTHRYNIRKKLGISHKKTNLATYILSIS